MVEANKLNADNIPAPPPGDLGNIPPPPGYAKAYVPALVQTGVIEKDEEIEEVVIPQQEDDGTGFGRFNRAATWRKKPE
jgi:hypothetical protein